MVAARGTLLSWAARPQEGVPEVAVASAPQRARPPPQPLEEGLGGGALSCPHLGGHRPFPRPSSGVSSTPPTSGSHLCAQSSPDELEGETPAQAECRLDWFLARGFVDIIDREE